MRPLHQWQRWTLKLALAIVASKQWEVHHMDVKCAFLNGDLTEYIYMQNPQVFYTNPSLVCRLKKSLYGLKQAPRLGMPRLMAFCYHWILFDASQILMFIWSWFMVLWWLLSCMLMTFSLQEAQMMQWTMHSLWLIWGYWANSWSSRLLKPNME